MSSPNPGRFLNRDLFNDPTEYSDLFPSDQPFVPLQGVSPLPRSQDLGDISDLFPESRPYLDPTLSGAAQPGGPADLSGPFARQKRELPALGYSPEQIAQLDQGLETLRQLDPKQRRNEFRKYLEMYRMMGMTADEVESLRSHLGVEVSTLDEAVQELPFYLKPFGQSMAADVNLAKSVGSGTAAIAEGYGEFVHKPLVKLGEGMRNNIDKARAKSRELHPFLYLPPVSDVKDVVAARNWKKLNEWADIGRLPTFDEMGEDYIQTVISELKEEMDPTQFRAAQKVMGYAFTNPRSSWFRRGEKVPVISTKFIADHPILAVAPLILQAPEEFVTHQITHPETWPAHAAIFLGGKYVINPATKAGLNWLNARFPLTVPLKEAWRWNKAYRSVRKFGKATPVSNEMVADFFMNLTNPDIMSRIPINTANPETKMMLEALQRRFRGMSPEDFGHFRLFFEKSATGDLNLFVPKDLSTLRKFAYGTPAGAQVPGAGLLAGPGQFAEQVAARGVVAPTAGAFDAAVAGRIPGTVPPRITGPGEFGAGAAVAGTPGAPTPQPPGPTAEQMSGLLLTADTGYTPDEISLSIRSGTTPETVRQLRMLVTDDEIIELGLEKAPEPTPTVQDSLLMKPTSRVRLPWQGDLEGTVISISDPEKIVVELDQGGDVQIPAEQINVIGNPAKDSSTVPIPLMGEGIPLAGGGQPPAITGTPEFVEEWFQAGQVTDGILVRYPHLAEKYGLQDRYMQALARAKDEYMTQGRVDLAVASVTNPSTGDPIDVPIPRTPTPGDPGEAPSPATIPLDKYLLETAPPELNAIKNIKQSLPFSSGDEKAIRRYFRAVEKAVAKFMPERLGDLRANIKAYDSGKATISDVDAIFASQLHTELANIQFADVKVSTGIDDPMEAALAHHRASVESALATNPDSVPDNVLVDYPDLADKYGRRDLGRESRRGLQALGYTQTQMANLLPSERNRLLSNQVASGNVTIMDDGQAYFSAFYEEVADPKQYKVERTVDEVTKAAKEDMAAAKQVAEQLKLDLSGEGGFVALPSIAQFRAVSDAVLTRAKRVFIPTPSDIQRDVMGAVEKWRADYNHAGLMVEWADTDLRKAIEKDNRFWDRLTPSGKERRAAIRENLAIVDDWMENPVVNQARLNALPSAWKSLAKSLRDDYNAMHTYATSEGIEITWRENYSPGMYKNNPDKTMNTMYPGTGKLGTRISAQKQKTYANKMEARADGLDPIEDPIYKHAQYQLALHRVIANKKLVSTIMNMYDTNGVPYIMFEPVGSKTGVYRDAWNSYERLDNIPGMRRLRFTATHDGIPILRIENVRAHPEAHAIITDVFDPYVRPGKFMRRYTYVRGLIKRGKMYNPMIHTWNVVSDALDEMNFNPYKTVQVFREGSRLWNRKPDGVRQVIANGVPMWNTRQEAVELAVKSGLETATSLSAANDLRRQFRSMHPAAPSWMDPDSQLAKATTGGIKLWRDMIHTSDKFLWHNVVLYAQLGTWQEICHSIAKKHPDWEAAKVARTASPYVNTLYGTLPHTWMKKGVRKWGNHIFFARNWCVSGDTRAMTKDGWKYHHELEVGDEILIFDPDTQEMKWSPMRDMFENPDYSGEMVRVKNYNHELLMTPDHKCYVWNFSKEEHEVVLAKDLQTNHLIPRVGSFELPEQPVFSDWFVKIVGWMVTDGHVKSDPYDTKSGTKFCRYGIITQSKPKGVEDLQSLGLKGKEQKPRKHNSNSDGVEYVENNPVYTFYVSTKVVSTMKDSGVDDGLSWEFLSKLTKSQLELLYDTMMLGDGTGQNRFCGKEREVFFMTMIQTMLGKPSTFYQQDENCWRTRIIKTDRIRTHDRTDTIDYNGTIWCPSVDTGFWVAERKGIVFVTGNTFANLNLAAYTATGGRGGLGSKFLEGDEQTEIFKRSGLHLLKGFVGLLATAGLLQQGIMRIKNQLAKEGIIDDPVEKPKWPWENEPGHLFDVYVGKNNKGQGIYYVQPFFRYFRDYIGWTTDARRTLLNKVHPVPKGIIEGLTNYEGWKKKEIWDENASSAAQLKQGLTYFVRSATPIEQFGFAGQPGKVQTTREWIAPFLGMWVRRGAPGGKYAGYMFEYMDEERRAEAKLDAEISEMIQTIKDVDGSEFITTMFRRYKTVEGVVNVLYRHNAYLNAKWDSWGSEDKVKFMVWLKENKGEDMTEFHMARALEKTVLLDRATNDVEDDTFNLDDMKREKLEEELLQRQSQLPPDQQGGDDDLLQMLQQFGNQ